MWQSLEILGITLNFGRYFNTLNLKQVPSKTKTFFKKLKHHFLVESIKIENKTFPYKTVLPESNVKTTRVGSTKLSYYKERNLGSIYFMFFEHFFPVYIKSWFNVPTTEEGAFSLHNDIFVIFQISKVLGKSFLKKWN